MKNILLIISILSVVFIGCKNENKNQRTYIEVVGYAEKEVAPDIFYLNFTLSENNSKKSDIAVLERKIVEMLTSLGIDIQKDLSVSDLSGSGWNWWRRTKNVYQNKSYSLRVTGIDLLNKACDKLDEIGYNDYYLGQVEYSKSDELTKEVQQQAVKQARTKAENLLAGEGKKVGELIWLKEQTANNSYDRFMNYDDKAYESEAPVINFKTIKITYNVVVSYSIK